jgi:hypothetical protein
MWAVGLQVKPGYRQQLRSIDLLLQHGWLSKVSYES